MKKLILGILAMALFASCGKDLLNKTEMLPLSQYADGVISYSSEFSAAPGLWSSFMVLGAPDTYPEYGDKQTAWASKTRDGADEYLELAFDTAQFVHQIEIFETFNPGAITSVSVRNINNGSWVPVYSEKVVKNLPKNSRIMTVDFPLTSYKVDAVKINIDSRSIPGWNEIDAVRILGEMEAK